MPKSVRLTLARDAFVNKGDVLWAGVKIAGDHVFVDKTKWNLRAPQRGEVMVFNTKNIATLPPGTHYIKRMVGLPSESVSIDPPRLLINGQVPTGSAAIKSLMAREGDYKGYKLVDFRQGEYDKALLKTSRDSIALNDDQYFALGDNTGNSRDGRYWGSVPSENLVGPAVVVYWPFSDRWGRIVN